MRGITSSSANNFSSNSLVFPGSIRYWHQIHSMCATSGNGSQSQVLPGRRYSSARLPLTLRHPGTPSWKKGQLLKVPMEVYRAQRKYYCSQNIQSSFMVYIGRSSSTSNILPATISLPVGLYIQPSDGVIALGVVVFVCMLIVLYLSIGGEPRSAKLHVEPFTMPNVSFFALKYGRRGSVRTKY